MHRQSFLAFTRRLSSQAWYPAQVLGIVYDNGVVLYEIQFQAEQVTHILDRAVRVYECASTVFAVSLTSLAFFDTIGSLIVQFIWSLDSLSAEDRATYDRLFATFDQS
jgi:hypothetical protein